MKKTKFKISGMHCKSCALLIEEKLKNKPGIITARVGHDSGKAAVIYDEQKIKQPAIHQAIKEAGEYEVTDSDEEEAAEEPTEAAGRAAYTHEVRQKDNNTSPKTSFLLGLLSSLLAISLIANIFLFTNYVAKNGNVAKVRGSADGLTDQVIPSAPSQPPAIAIFSITKDDHIRGDFDAPITLVEFSDFECPFCGRFYPTTKKILADYKDKVRLVYKHFPLSFHPNAQKAAEASECADEQGKFWEYHDTLFENQPQGYTLDEFKQWAKDVGLNAKKFNDCLDSGKFAQKVKSDYQEGLGKGVNGTPATFVNGQLISGALPYESFKQIIDTILSS